MTVRATSADVVDNTTILIHSGNPRMVLVLLERLPTVIAREMVQTMGAVYERGQLDLAREIADPDCAVLLLGEKRDEAEAP